MYDCLLFCQKVIFFCLRKDIVTISADGVNVIPIILTVLLALGNKSAFFILSCRKYCASCEASFSAGRTMAVVAILLSISLKTMFVGLTMGAGDKANMKDRDKPH